MIIGAGPTGLGAAYRFFEHNDSIANNTEVIVLEMEQQAGGLGSSYRDDKGFLWDNGGHVVFSHYDYFNRVLKKAVRDWNKQYRASYAYMMGSSGRRKFIPYPVSFVDHHPNPEDGHYFERFGLLFSLSSYIAAITSITYSEMYLYSKMVICYLNSHSTHTN